MKSLLLITLSAFYSFASFARNGTIRGKITDGITGEGLYGATVLKQGTGIGVVTDFDGNFCLALAPGVHSIVITFISYQSQSVEGVEVKAGEITTLDVVMQSAVSELDEVIVTGALLKDSEYGIMTYQRKSPNVVDGISSQTFRKAGDRDLSSAIRRVTGVSVEDGKYVYVRGLGDRYTRTTLNGMTLPGLDPDRNDVQIDIFPTSALENVVVFKTSSPNLPGDFTGGMVDVETKKFPDVKTTSASMGFGYNPKMNLNPDFLTYQGGKTDWLGFDDGTRKLPFPSSTVIPNIASANADAVEPLTRSLNPRLAPIRKNSFLNTSFSFNHGNHLNRDRFTLGYTAILNYRSQFEYFDDIEFGDYTKNDDRSNGALFAEEIIRGSLGRSSVQWSALLAGAIKFDKHEFSTTVLRIQSGVSESSNRISRDYDQTLATLSENILTYSQRSVSTGILSGAHQLGKLRAEWKNSFTLSRTYDPDFRETSIDISDPNLPTLNVGAGAGIRRFWRDLNERNENFKLDFTLPYGEKHKLQFGIAGLYKDRQFDVFNYRVNATSRTNVPVDPDYFLRPENVWTASGRTGTFIVGNKEPSNNYSAKSSVYASYVMTEMELGKFRAIYGLRAEQAMMFYTGVDISGRTYHKSQTLNEFDLLPSVNLVYSISEMSNLRASYGRTLARPSFREKSAASIYDPITKRFFNGNLNLRQTDIDNYDFRWERIASGGDMISFSTFFKHFSGHIEMVTYDVATDNVKPRNAGDSRVYGMEVELKKQLGFIGSVFERVAVGTNVTLAHSEVDLKSVTINESGLSEFESRQNNAREGEAIDPARPMGGQSPYLVNAFVNYVNKALTFNANLSYNVQGENLAVIGVGAVPDVYTQPFHSLNFNAFYDFGINGNHRVTVGTTNILNEKRVDKYKGYGGVEAIYSRFHTGRTFTLTYAYTF